MQQNNLADNLATFPRVSDLCPAYQATLIPLSGCPLKPAPLTFSQREAGSRIENT